MAKGEDGVALNPTDQQDPNRRRCGFGLREIQLRIYGLVAALILTLALIVILERVNKSLPDGSKTRYDSKLAVREIPGPNDIVGRDTSTSAVVSIDPSGGSSQVFVPVSITTTIASQCPVRPLTCQCPPDELFNCNCLPDPSVTFCTCAVKVKPSCPCDPLNDPTCNCGPDPFYRDCVCPPDSRCNRCTCPGPGSFREPCPCPADPFAARCDNFPRPPSCIGEALDECGCSVIQEWQCGSNVARPDCSAATSTIGGVFSSVVTVVPIFTTVSSTTDSSSPAVITPASSKAPSETPDPIIQTTVASVLVTSLSSTSSVLESISVTASVNPAVPPSGNSIKSPDPTPVVSTISAITSTGSLLSISGALLASTLGTVISSGVISAGLQTALGPGAIILVSSSLIPATNGSASFSVVAVTFIQTTPSPSASVVTGPSGSVFTIPSQILNIGPIITPPAPGTPLVSPSPVEPAAPTAPFATVTSPPFTTIASSVSVSSNPPVTVTASSGFDSSAIALSLSDLELSSGTTAPAGTSQQGNSDSSIIPPQSSSTTASAAFDTLNPSITAASQTIEDTSALISASTLPSDISTAQPSQTPDAGSSSIKVAIYSWPVSKTVLGGYVPVLFARLFTWAWTAIYFPLGGAETMRQLSRTHKASSAILFGTGTALWYIWPGHVAAWLISPFASELIYFDTNYDCPNPNLANPSNPCWPPIMSVNTWVTRVLEAFLALVAITILILIGLWFKRPSSRAVDPTSITTVGVLMGHPEVERDFKAFDGNISMKEMTTQLIDKRYQLNTYHTAEGTERYGIVPVSSQTGLNQTQDVLAISDPSSPPVTTRIRSTFNFGTDWKKFQLGSDIIFMGYLFGIIGAAILYVSHINNLTTIHLFDNSTFGRRFLFAVLACIASSYWTRLQRDAQTLAPYAQLAYPNTAPPQQSILLTPHSLVLTAITPLLRHKHFIAGATAFTALLAEFLIIAFSGLPYRPGQLRSEFLFCGITSLVILAVMVVMLLVVLLWRMLSVPHLPRKPNTMAAVMSYLCDSAMVKEFEGLEFAQRRDRDRAVKGMGRRYAYGERRGRDGKVRWVVDSVGQEDVVG